MNRRYEAARRLNHISSSFRLAALAAALVLAGCDLLGEDSKKTATWIGKPIDSLTSVSSISLHGGRLFVANRHATEPGVAVVDTATGLITEYYPEAIAPSSLAFTSSGHLVITETSFDYSEGSVSVLDPVEKTIRKNVITFGSDNGAVAAEDGRVYLFDHTSGTVTGFTGNTPGANVVFDAQTGADENPYGIAVANGKAYIPRYNSKSLLILDATAMGGGARDSVDLSAYAKDTATFAPRMAHVTVAGGYVFVTLQRLTATYAANDTSLVVVINASTKAVEKVIPLNFRNPVSANVHDGVWYVAGVAGYGTTTGGVEKIDLVTRAHAGVAVTEASLGGDVSEFLPTGAASGYAVYSPAWPVYKIKRIAP
jgi:hypothetical protein